MKTQPNILDNMRFSFGAAVRFENETGQNMFSALGLTAGDDGKSTTDFSSFSFPKIAKLCHAAVFTKDNPISFEEFMDVLSEMDIKDVLERMTKALSESMPDDESQADQQA